MRINKGDTLTIAGNKSYTEVIENYGTILFDPEKSGKITTTKNIINYGKIVASPASKDIVHEIEFSGVNESRYVGGGMVPLDSDIGLWNMAGGTMDFKGTYKTPFTNSEGSIPIGAKSIVLLNTEGWEAGDEIVVSPTENPPFGAKAVTWNQTAKTYTDPFNEKFERRIITRVSDRTVYFDQPLKFAHNEVRTEPNKLAPNGRVFKPYVQNLTRNIKIHGTESGKAHIFSCSHGEPDEAGKIVHHHQKHLIENVEFYFMGPRKVGGHRYQIPETVLGRYVLHFHHGGEGTQGSMVRNCSFHDNGSRVCVPHLSHGITFKANSFYNNNGEEFWWDFQELSHDIDYDGNLITAGRWDKIMLGRTNILLGIGDNNKCRNNWIVGGGQGREDGAGAYQWTTDNESVWVFDNNGGNSCHNLDWTWQNSGRPHAITKTISVNNNFGLHHGAYQNTYIYADNEYYNSFVFVKASGGTWGGSSFDRCVFDGMDKLEYCAQSEPSPVQSWPNQFKKCEFRGYTKAAVSLNLFPQNPSAAKPRKVELINNIYSNPSAKAAFLGYGQSVQVPDTYFRIQDGDKSIRLDPPNKTTNIPKFAPDDIGTGEGLRGEYFKGSFEQKVFERIDSYVRFDDWVIEFPKMPAGISRFLNTGSFSVRWSGYIQPFYDGDHQFRLNGASGYRLWVDNKLIIDSPENKNSNASNAVSDTIKLNRMQKYAIRIECYDPGDTRKGILFYWKAGLMGDFQDVPMSQLYSAKLIPPPPPPDEEPNIPPMADLVWSEYIEMYPDLQKAGIDTEAEAIRHYERYGQKEGRYPSFAARDAANPPVQREFVLADTEGKETSFEIVDGFFKVKD